MTSRPATIALDAVPPSAVALDAVAPAAVTRCGMWSE